MYRQESELRAWQRRDTSTACAAIAASSAPISKHFQLQTAAAGSFGVVRAPGGPTASQTPVAVAEHMGEVAVVQVGPVVRVSRGWRAAGAASQGEGGASALTALSALVRLAPSPPLPCRRTF